MLKKGDLVRCVIGFYNPGRNIKIEKGQIGVIINTTDVNYKMFYHVHWFHLGKTVVMESDEIKNIKR